MYNQYNIFYTFKRESEIFNTVNIVFDIKFREVCDDRVFANMSDKTIYQSVVHAIISRREPVNRRLFAK